MSRHVIAIISTAFESFFFWSAHPEEITMTGTTAIFTFTSTNILDIIKGCEKLLKINTIHLYTIYGKQNTELIHVWQTSLHDLCEVGSFNN